MVKKSDKTDASEPSNQLKKGIKLASLKGWFPLAKTATFKKMNAKN